MRLVVLFATALLFGATPGRDPIASPQGQDPSPQGQDKAAAKATTLDLLARLIPAVEGELGRDGADPTDVRALSRRLGSPPAALQFVRDNIAFEPYEGVLRGPEGALAARAANSWDQALLLQALLTAMGQASRIVQSQLDDTQCNTLVDAFLQAAPRPEPAGDAAKALADAARATGIPAAQMQDLVGKQDATADSAFAEMQQLAATHAGLLRAALRDHAVDGASMRAAAVASVRRHAFLQLAAKVDGQARYRDFDATPLGAADGSSSAREGAPPPELPRHRLRVQLQYQTDAGTTTIMDQTSDVADALRQPLRFSVAGADDPLPPARLAAMTPEERLKQLLHPKRWQAWLGVGDTDRASRVFDLDGNLFDVGGDGRVRAAGDLGGGVAKGFDAFGGGDSAPKDRFVKLSLVTTLLAPGGSERTFPRLLLDAAGKARGDTPATRWDLLVLGGRVSQAFAGYEQLVAQLPYLRELRGVLASESPDWLAAIDRLAPVAAHAAPIGLLCVQTARQRQIDALAARGGLRAWLSEPQVLVVEQKARDCAEGAGCLTVRCDWMASDVRFLAIAADQAATAFAAALEQGAFDSIAEARSLEEAMPDAAVDSAAHALNRARAGGHGLSLRAPSGQRLELAVDGEAAWFEVDALFGCSVGRIPGGYGGAMARWTVPQGTVEYAKLAQSNVGLVLCLTLVAYKGGSGAKQLKGVLVCALGYGFKWGGSFVSSAGLKTAMDWISMFALFGVGLYASS